MVLTFDYQNVEISVLQSHIQQAQNNNNDNSANQQQSLQIGSPTTAPNTASSTQIQQPQKNLGVQQQHQRVNGVSCVEGYPVHNQSGVQFQQMKGVGKRMQQQMRMPKLPSKRLKSCQGEDKFAVPTDYQVQPQERSGWPERLQVAQVKQLKTWFFNNLNFPFPSAEQVDQEAYELVLQPGVIENFFFNARQRVWKPVVERIFKMHAQRLIQQLVNKQDSESLNWVLGDLRKGWLDCERILSIFDDVAHQDLQEVGRRLESGSKLSEILEQLSQEIRNKTSIKNNQQNISFKSNVQQQQESKDQKLDYQFQLQQQGRLLLEQ